MPYQSDYVNLAKQLVLSQVNVSSSGERVFEEKPELILKKKEILNNLSLSEEQKKSKIGELLLTPEDNTEGSIMAEVLWTNSSAPKTQKEGTEKLDEIMKKFVPTGYLSTIKNDPSMYMNILQKIYDKTISDQEKISAVQTLLKITDPLTVQTTVHEPVTSPPPDPAAHHDHLLDNSSSLIRGFREVASVTTSGGHHHSGLLNRLLAPLMRFYTKIQAANRLVTGEASPRDPAEPGLSGEQLMKAAFILNNQHRVIQASGQWREISSIPVETAPLSFFNQSRGNPIPQVGVNFW